MMPDKSSLCEFHYGQWWANNHQKVAARATSNPMCDDIRAAYARSPKGAGLEALAESMAERAAA